MRFNLNSATGIFKSGGYIHHMMLALLLSFALANPQPNDPPAVRVQLNHDQFRSGDNARVYVETARDGYLIVLHADPQGRVRVLFPLDPSDDEFVRGGRRQELRGRSDRDAFQVDDDDGSGTVLAAVTPDPFTFTEFVRNDHWDFRALGGPSASVRTDPLAGLLDIVQRMAGETHFDYDDATYVVLSRQIASRYDDGYGFGYPYHSRLGLGFGYPYRFGSYDPFYDPFCFDPFWGTRCYRRGFGFGLGFPVYRPYRHYPYVFNTTLGAGFAGRGGQHFVIPTNRGRYSPVQPRPRADGRSFVSPPRAMPRFSGGRSSGSRPSVRSFGGSRGRSGGGRRH